MSDTILLDIDGTLVDSTYHHAIAWHRALHRNEVDVPLWRIHRTIGMGGDRLVAEVAGDDVEDTREVLKTILDLDDGRLDSLERAGVIASAAASGAVVAPASNSVTPARRGPNHFQ